MAPGTILQSLQKFLLTTVPTPTPRTWEPPASSCNGQWLGQLRTTYCGGSPASLMTYGISELLVWINGWKFSKSCKHRRGATARI